MLRLLTLHQWGHIGLMLIIYLVLPESPAWCASRDKPERAKKSMRFIYRGVDGFDADAQYEVLATTIAHEKAVAEENKSIQWWSIFKGVNGVSDVRPFGQIKTKQLTRRSAGRLSALGP